jgi:threonine/homoserine/homoserine lactone efflux protein
MLMEGLLGFILAGFALAGSPGPSNLSLAAVGAAFGARRTLGYLAGIVTGLVPVMAITGSGALGVLLAVPGATPVVLALVAAYFAYLAFRIATAPPLREHNPHVHQPSFAGGAFLSLVNPKGYAAFAALFSGFVLVRDRVGLDLALKVAVLVAIIAAASLGWLLGGAALTRFFRDPRSNRILNIAFAVLLLASLAVMLWV